MSDDGDLLRRAAHIARELGGRAVAGPWWTDEHIGNDGMVVMGCGSRRAHVPGGGPQPVYDAEWIALMSPAVAEPLAAWLDREAANADRAYDECRGAVEFARALLREEAS